MSDEQQLQTHSQSKPTPPEETKGSKNIVICCDGTGNQFGDANSNVVKLYTALAIDDGQMGYYHPGVGTMGDPGERHRVLRWWSKVKGLAFAAGFKDNVFDAYRYLMTIYNDGDRVYLFGFSRGAYTVRALAGLLDGYGLLCRGNEGHLPYAWRLYADQHSDRKKHHLNHKENDAAAFKETFSRKDFTIYFVGIWDTVSSIGWISTPLRLFSVAQNRTILRGRHAVSIDERRCFYHDNLWGEPLPGQNIMQVWFPGVHSDVGGSYSQETSGLSNIALEWMLIEARNAGVRLVDDRVDLVIGEQSVSYPETKALYKKPTSSEVHHSLNGLWWILELLPHVYYDKDHGEELYRVPLGARRVLPTGALVHHSAKDLIDDDSVEYHPRNLVNGKLTPVANGSNRSDREPPLLFTYARPENKSNPFQRWVVMILFSLLDLAVALCIITLVVNGGARLWPHLWCFCKVVGHFISSCYFGLSAWVLTHLGPKAQKLFFCVETIFVL